MWRNKSTILVLIAGASLFNFSDMKKKNNICNLKYHFAKNVWCQCEFRQTSVNSGKDMRMYRISDMCTSDICMLVYLILSDDLKLHRTLRKQKSKVTLPTVKILTMNGFNVHNPDKRRIFESLLFFPPSLWGISTIVTFSVASLKRNIFWAGLTKSAWLD